MKNALKVMVCFAVAAVLTFGISLVNAPDAEAITLTCPPCYVPDGASGWTQVGSCIGGPSHCPVSYRTYRNNYTGQICRGQFGVANI